MVCSACSFCGAYACLCLVCSRYAGLVSTLILELLGGVPLRTAVASTAAELGITNLEQLARVPPPVGEDDGRPMLPPAFGDLPVMQKGFGLSCCKRSQQRGLTPCSSRMLLRSGLFLASIDCWYSVLRPGSRPDVAEFCWDGGARCA